MGRLVHGAAEPLLLIDEAGVVVYANPAAYSAFSPSPVGCRLDDLFTIEDRPLGGQNLADLLGSDGYRRAALVTTRDGIVVEAEIAVGPLAEGTASVVVHLGPDVQVSTAELLRRATHDDLTQLVNRTTFSERVAAALVRVPSARTHGLFVIDLDGFKAVNDGFGHEIGDQVLVEMARRLRRSCRPEDVVARLGGDEFALWCPDLRDDHGVTQLAHRLLQALAEPVRVGSHDTSLGASIGIVLTTGGFHEVSNLLSKADAAMYRAKAAGRGRFDIYDEQLGVTMLRQRTIESTLAQAIADDQLELHCDAIVDLLDGRAVGAEALARWEHPQLGLIEPREFVPVATRAKAMGAVTTWMLEATCRELAMWNAALVEPVYLTLDVGVALLHNAFIDGVEDMLANHSVSPQSLTLEIDEAELSSTDPAALGVLSELRGIGVRIALDHFGTGGSPLSQLHEVPLDAVKLDRSLSAGLAASKRQQALAEGIIGISHGLGLVVIAEGVDQKDDLSMLRELGCDLGQGRAFGMITPASSARWLPSPPDLRLG